MHQKQAEQLYSITDVARILKLSTERINVLMQRNEMLGPDVLVPGGGHKAARWSASRIAMIQRNWSHPASHAA